MDRFWLQNFDAVSVIYALLFQLMWHYYVFLLIILYFDVSGMYVENLTEYVVRTPQEVMQFLAAGKKKLVFGETKMNRTSSRY